jgi:general secretion pathway protein G
MRDTHNTTQRAGFTLIEMLLVVTIIGILAAMAVLKIGGQGEVARRETTRGTIATISQAIQMYGLSHSGLPDSLDELTIPPSEDVEAPLDKNSLSDSWGQPIQYKKLSKVKFELRSGGTDKQIGTEDDLTN